MLNLAPAGCVGVHASLLPKYRGAAPVSAAILAGDLETGVSLMLTEAGMDSGPVIAQQAMPVAADDTTGSLTARLADLGAELLVRTLPSWLRGGIVPTPQDGSAATYAPETRREDGGIDWYESAVRIDRVVRAMQPWPGAFCGCGEATLKIGAARPVSDWRGDGQPGSVVRLGREVGVVTGDGLLLLDTVQLEGRRAMHAGDFARGRGDLYELVLACALRRT
jgi:methionyl-tRNA formyltransferase